MRITGDSVALANELRVAIQDRTETISDGEGVAIVLLWTFFMDHARAHGIDVADLAREQIEAFIVHGAPAIQLVRGH